jgi:malate synthase
MVAVSKAVKQKFDGRINQPSNGFVPEEMFTREFLEFLSRLHREFTPRQQALIARRAEVLSQSHQGTLPNHLPSSNATTDDWKIELPAWCRDQRNQMTGPADDAELVVKMLNSGAPGVMIDLEDSMANQWSNLFQGIQNTLKALHGQLFYFDKKRNQITAIKASDTVIFVRARGLHINQAGIFPNELMSASLFDVATVAFNVETHLLKHPLCFYIPKSESAAEASWWNDLFKAIAKYRGWDERYIKCMALVEAHSMAYQMEEFTYNLRDHLIGLNLGRWDYMASLIHFNLQNPAWVLPDRNTIPHDVPFFQRLRELLVEICHKRGLLAIGGMTALFPSRVDNELNERALKVLEADKRNEANCFMDGAWTGHPDQNEIAVNQFPNPNQNFARRENTERYTDLRPQPTGVGKHTLQGTRAAIRTVIRYRNGVLNGKGASLLDGYMEDLATDRIYRLMIAQRVLHRDVVAVVDENGNVVMHTPELITKLFDEELERIINEVDSGEAETYREARRISEEMIIRGEFDPI